MQEEEPCLLIAGKEASVSQSSLKHTSPTPELVPGFPGAPSSSQPGLSFAHLKLHCPAGTELGQLPAPSLGLEICFRSTPAETSPES